MLTHNANNERIKWQYLAYLQRTADVIPLFKKA